MKDSPTCPWCKGFGAAVRCAHKPAVVVNHAWDMLPLLERAVEAVRYGWAHPEPDLLEQTMLGRSSMLELRALIAELSAQQAAWEFESARIAEQYESERAA